MSYHLVFSIYYNQLYMYFNSKCKFAIINMFSNIKACLKQALIKENM